MIARHTDDFLWSKAKIDAQLRPHVEQIGDCLVYTGEDMVTLELRGKGREITKQPTGYKRRMVPVDESGKREKMADMAPARAALLASMGGVHGDPRNASAFIGENQIAVHRAVCPHAHGRRKRGRFHVCISPDHLYAGTKADQDREAEARKVIASAPQTKAA